MKTNHVGQLVFGQTDLCDLLLQGHAVHEWQHVIVDPEISIDALISALPDCGAVHQWQHPVSSQVSVDEFDQQQQTHWHMPASYQNMDIAQWVLDQCQTDAELQRCGQELLMYQERELFNLLRYLKYLVDLMQEQNLVWGVGRGSSVASYVLYKIGVHHIDSMFYDLDPAEFLR